MWVRMRLIEALLVPSYRDLAHPSGFTGEARLGVGYQTGDWTPIFRFPRFRRPRSTSTSLSELDSGEWLRTRSPEKLSHVCIL